MHAPTVLSLFSGAGGLDLGFEQAGFTHLETIELDTWCVDSLRKNRPEWNPREIDIREYAPDRDLHPDVLIAGPPCQGFSLGGNRQPTDLRNDLFREVVRVARVTRPKVVVIENVLNLRTMVDPISGLPFSTAIAQSLEDLDYRVSYSFFRMAQYGVPQTRRRFVFIAIHESVSLGEFVFPAPMPTEEPARKWLTDLASGRLHRGLPNHCPSWDFASRVHRISGVESQPGAPFVPFRISRTASDGNPLRSLDAPFPAVDTATVWGWAQGNVTATRMEKDRATGSFIRNPHATVKLWRVTADRMRAFTHREYARLQTFPDDWQFVGGNKRDVQKQIGNAVPVEFARRLGLAVNAYLSERAAA
jgi:DNA (cytosine-5)-methyltransferase 1